MAHTYPNPRPMVTVDILLLRQGRETPELLLIRRKHDPFEGHWALPGGFVDMEEDLGPAAARELEEETGLSAIPLTQFRCYGAPGRDPRGRTITVVYTGWADAAHETTAGDDAAEAVWFPVSALPPLAFDHGQIIAEALAHMKVDP